MSPKTKGIIEMLACASLWSIAGIFIKLINCSGFVIAGFRGIFAALVTALYIKYGGIGFKWNRTVLRTAIFMCLLFTAFVVSNKYTTAANAIVLQFTTPIWIMLYEWLVTKKHLARKDIVAAVCTLLGIALCFFDKLDGGRMIGNCIAVFAGLMMAFMYICLGSGTEQEKINGTFFGH
ncbi:MAG: DMT family transporter, partial [Firmicutes bacterium]|nr:DMT family transporter [Bacillota bacterium]MBR6025631.1 DMT family transporter [Bacillota bacterium]